MIVSFVSPTNNETVEASCERPSGLSVRPYSRPRGGLPGAAVLLFLYALPDFPQFVKGHDMSLLFVLSRNEWSLVETLAGRAYKATGLDQTFRTWFEYQNS